MFYKFDNFCVYIKEAFGNQDEDRAIKRQLLILRQTQSAMVYGSRFKTAQGNECQSLCLCSQEDIWDSEEKNIIKLGVWKKCDHCKGHHELCLNYNSENNSSSWADMMEKDLEWNKQQDLDDENQKVTHNIES